jgi:hypothetical protein
MTVDAMDVIIPPAIHFLTTLMERRYNGPFSS